MEEMKTTGILESLLEYRQAHQQIHLKERKTGIKVNLKSFCLPVRKLNSLKIEKPLFDLF